MDDPHLAGGPDHAVLHIVAPATPQRLCRGLDHALLIFGVDQFQQLRVGEDLRLRLQSKDAIGLVRPGEAIRLEVALPVADVREALGLLSLRSLSRKVRNIKRLVRASSSRRPISWKSRSSCGVQTRGYAHWLRPNMYG